MIKHGKKEQKKVIILQIEQLDQLRNHLDWDRIANSYMMRKQVVYKC